MLCRSSLTHSLTHSRMCFWCPRWPSPPNVMVQIKTPFCTSLFPFPSRARAHTTPASSWGETPPRHHTLRQGKQVHSAAWQPQR